jgi:serine protease Do
MITSSSFSDATRSSDGRSLGPRAASNGWKWGRILAGLAAGCAAIALAGVTVDGRFFGVREALAEQPPVADAATADALEHASSLSRAFRHAAEIATPSVVVVRSEMKARRVGVERGPRGGGENPFKGTPFEDFFNEQMPDGLEFRGPVPPRGGGVGSGVIVDSSGIVLTNNHVVENADSVVVELSDGREFEAVEIKTDPDSDLAVVMLKDADDLPAARLGNSDELEIGDWVIAIGNPFELETTVSAGIISGKGRELGSIRRAQFLQTDAAINPGNSGGPLVNLRGEVVGINTAIASNNGGYQGIGFAIPVNQARWVSEQLIAKGAVERGYMGVTIAPLSADVARQLKVPTRKGVLVTQVLPDSPAAVAGMQELDVVVSFAGKPVDSPRTLQEVVERSSFEASHEVGVVRDGKLMKLNVGVKPLPEQVAASARTGRMLAPSGDDSYVSAELGFAVRDPSDEEREAMDSADGVVIDRVDPEGVAASAGLAPGLMVYKVGKKAVSNVAEFERAMQDESPEDGVLLSLRTPRGNQVLVLRAE